MAEDEAARDPDRPQETPPRRRRGRRVVAVLAILAVAAWAVVAHRPGWWTQAGDTSPAAVARGTSLENAVVTEMTRVRDDATPWGFVVGDDDVNAWLANRLDPWIESRRDLEWPPGVRDPRVRFGDDGLEIGVAGPALGVVVVDLGVTLEDGELVLRPRGGGIGLLPVGESAIESIIAPLRSLLEANAASAGFRVDDDGAIRGRPTFRLSDGREVELLDLEIVAGELAVRWRTLGP